MRKRDNVMLSPLSMKLDIFSVQEIQLHLARFCRDVCNFKDTCLLYERNIYSIQSLLIHYQELLQVQVSISVSRVELIADNNGTLLVYLFNQWLMCHIANNMQLSNHDVVNKNMSVDCIHTHFKATYLGLMKMECHSSVL